MNNIIPLKRKHAYGLRYKGIKRLKSDDQPGKAVRTGTRKLTRLTIPKRGRRYRIPRGLPGTPMGKPIRERKAA